MDAQTGKNFLINLLHSSQHPMDEADLEEAIKIAGEKSPSSAFKVASCYYQMRHGGGISYLGFAKGTRWLAMIRRDEGNHAFEKACDELRKK